MAVNYQLQDQFLDQLQNATQMPVLLKPLDIEAYKKFYRDLSRQLLLSIKPKE